MRRLVDRRDRCIEVQSIGEPIELSPAPRRRCPELPAPVAESSLPVARLLYAAPYRRQRKGKGPRGDMCACAVGDSWLRVVYALPKSSRCLLVRQGRGQCAAPQIVLIRMVFTHGAPFTLEWHCILKCSL